MMAMNFTQWLSINKNNGNVANQANIKKFLENYLTPENRRLKNFAADKYWNSDIQERADSALASYKTNDFLTTQARLDAWVIAINNFCQQIGEKDLLNHPVARYAPKDATDGWTSETEALALMDLLAENDELPTRQPLRHLDAPRIPGIKWSTAKLTLPRQLVRLIRDIRNAARVNNFVDERNTMQRGAKSITPDAPGTLRSWHVNDQGSLPRINQPVPASALHTHYQATSQKPGNTDQALTAPAGYAEYTGTGILNDAHSVKIVMDYTYDNPNPAQVNFNLYVTVTHYKRWNKSPGDKPTYEVKDKSSGDNSAWFYIDFRQ